MSDPVDTDALRGKARVLWKRGAIARGFGDESDIEDADIDLDASRLLRAAADEVDRLREVIKTMRLFSDEERAARATARTAVMVDYVPAEELSRLRAVIKNAPHEDDCMQGLRGIPCDCWKADAIMLRAGHQPRTTDEQIAVALQAAHKQVSLWFNSLVRNGSDASRLNMASDAIEKIEAVIGKADAL